MNKDKVKKITGIVVGYSVGVLISTMVKSNTPDDINGLNKALIGLGSVAIAGLVGKHVGNYIDETVDGLSEVV